MNARRQPGSHHDDPCSQARHGDRTVRAAWRRRLPLPADAGFTLIELLAALAIAATLATLAWAAYDEHVRATRRAEARGALTEAALAMEINFTTSGRYDRDATGTAMATGLVPNSPPFPALLLTAGGGDPGRASYDLRFREAPTADRYALVALRRPGGSMAGDACGDFVVDHTGWRGIADALPSAAAINCWDRGRP